MQKEGVLPKIILRTYYLQVMLYFLLPIQLQSAEIPFYFDHINHFQGLSNNTVECILQDKKGFIWIGTRDGLNRYDGYNIITFRRELSKPNGLRDNFITHLFEDSSDRLWIGTLVGLNLYDRNTNLFTYYKLGTTLLNHHITGIIQTKGKLLVTTRSGEVYCYHPDEDLFKLSVKINGINCAFIDDKGEVWLGTTKGLYHLDSDNKTIRGIKKESRIGETELNIVAIAEDSQRRLWLGTDNDGIFIYNKISSKFESIPIQIGGQSILGSNQIRAILKSCDGSIWVGSVNGGLVMFDVNGKRLHHFTADPGKPGALSQRTISSLYEDKQGNLWIGTHRGGINLYSPTAKKFTIHRKTADPHSLGYNDVTSFCEDINGKIWIGTDGGGLDLYDPESRSFRHFRHDPKNSSSIGSDAVLNIFQDSKDQIWISTWGGGLNRYDPSSNTFKRFTHDPHKIGSITSNYVHELYEDSKGCYWVATFYGGLNKFDPKTETFQRFSETAGGKYHIRGDNIVAIEEDRHGNLWFGTDNGLNCYLSEKEKIEHYFDKEEKRPYLRVISIDRKGQLWAGVYGLYKFDEQKRVFTKETENTDLAEDLIRGILDDEKGNLWVSTQNGLVCFNPNTKALRRYNMNDGLQDMEFEAGAYLKLRDGTLLFGGINGFNWFHPNKLQKNLFKPPVYLTSMEMFNKKVMPGEEGSPLDRDISVLTDLHLTYKQSSFAIGFSALNYAAAENNQYAYMLAGFDQDWVYTKNINKAIYTNLSPGKYTFKVKAANNDGVWNENARMLTITITPPFWETWWFRTIVFIGLCLTVCWIINLNIKKERKRFEEQKKKELLDLQLQFFTNISHEFRTPISLILGPIERLINQGGAHHTIYQLIYRNANRLLSLINELMDFRKMEHGGYDLQVASLDMKRQIEMLSNDFKLHALEKGINFHLEVDSQIDETWYDANLVEKILLNLLNNAFKYTPNHGEVKLTLSTNPGIIQPKFSDSLVIENTYKARRYGYIIVEDTGIGISSQSINRLFERYYRIADYHMGSGVGLAFVKNLTLLHKGKIWVYSELDKGSQFVIALAIDEFDFEEMEKIPSSLSLKEEPEHEINEKDDTEKKIVSKNRPSILLVEDHHELRQFIRQELEDDFEISEATNGLDALKRLESAIPDAIISDVMMPKMDGIELCKHLKRSADTHHIPFIMLSAKNDVNDQLVGVDAGADHYYPKPLNTSLLKRLLKNLFIQRSTLKRKLRTQEHSEAIDKVQKKEEKKMLQNLIKIVEENIQSPSFDVDSFCAQAGVSRTKLYHEIKVLTGKPIGEFIRSIRLNRALHLIMHDNMSISEAMHLVGIQTQSYFVKAFKKEFGKTPKQYLKGLREEDKY